MNVKISEKRGGGWSLWVTEKEGDAEPPIYTASGRTREQVMALLPVILAGVTERPTVVVAAAETFPVGRSDTPRTNRQVGAQKALATVLDTLDGWIEGAHENHEALGHRHENAGEECWRRFAPEDIRRMVNDAAQELRIPEFPPPVLPREDRAWG